MKTKRIDSKRVPADWKVLLGEGGVGRTEERRETHQSELQGELIYTWEEKGDRLPTLSSKFFVRVSKTESEVSQASSTSSPSTSSHSWVESLIQVLAFLASFFLSYKAMTLATVSTPIANSLAEIITAIGIGIGGAGTVGYLHRRLQRRRHQR